MNILIVGNGFDLAHGLPTKYADFLKFIDFFYKHKAQESSRLELIAGEDINCYKYFTDLFNSKQDSEFDQYLYDQSRKTIHELSDLCKDNAWIKYFSEVYKSREQKGKDGWIDFESEISLIIQTFNSVSRDIQETIQKPANKKSSVFLKKISKIRFDILCITFKPPEMPALKVVI